MQARLAGVLRPALPNNVRSEVATLAAALIADLPHGHEMVGVGARSFNLRAFLLGSVLDETCGSEEEKRIIDALSRKLEIRGELHYLYELPGFSPAPGQFAAPRDVDAFLTLLLLRFAQTGDYRLLNTVLKATTGVLRIPAYEPSPALRALLEYCMAALIDDV